MLLSLNKTVCAFLTTAVLLAGSKLSGQVELDLTVEPVRAILFESIYAQIVIRNNTGGILSFDRERDSARFFFELERRKHNAVRQKNHTPLMFGVNLVPGGSKTNVFDLTSLYSMQSHGMYKLKAYLEWNNLLFVSQPVVLELLNGFEIARLIAGVPGEQGEIRAYILEYLGKKKGEQVFLRIEDSSSSKVFAVHKLGHIVRVRKPEMKIDEAGNVHVLFQTMAMVFVHTAFTPYGVHLFSRNYLDKSNRIALVNLPNGRVSVEPLPPKENISSGNILLPMASSSNLVTPAESRLGRGGLFGPKPE